MAVLFDQFKKACSNVEPDDDVTNASAAHLEVREVLGADPLLMSWKIDTLLIGSYARHASIRRITDVDVFCKVPEVDTSLTSQEVLTTFLDVLVAVFGADRVKKRDRSIQVAFPDYDLHVDVVPARPLGENWELPQRTVEGADWQETNPIKFGELTAQMNKDFNELYVPVVKLIRQTRRTALGKRPGGLYFEVLTYHAFASGLTGQNIQTLYVQALEHIAGQLQAVVDGGTIDDPALETPINVRVSVTEFATAATAFAKVAKSARDAYDDDNSCRAAKTYQDLLGTRSDDAHPVFELPDYCNADGTTKAGLSAGESTVPGSGNSPRFARR